MNCGCEDDKSKKKFSILKGKKNLLHLIRGISDEDQENDENIVKTETLQEEINTMVGNIPKEENSIEKEINLKKLEYILEKIENLRYNKI
jgi:hypothetical protein